MSSTTEKVRDAVGLPKSGIIFWRDWPSYFGSPTMGELRYLILNRKDRNFDKCIRRFNNKIFLSVEETLRYFNEDCKEI